MSADNGNATKNDTNLDSYQFFQVEQYTLLCILFVVIVAGNVGVLYTLHFAKSRKSRMNYFITHLALADLSVGVINVLTDIIWKITVDWYAGNIACKVIRFMMGVVTYASNYVLVALSIDRYDAIRHPMKFSGRWSRAKCLIISAWFFSALFSISILIFFEERTIGGKKQCWIGFEHQWKWQLYMTLVSVSLFIIPAIIIATCYTVIIVTIWSKNAKGFIKNTKTSNGSDNSRRASSRGLIPRAKVKTVKITLVIVSVFILCWSPYIIFDLLQVFKQIPETQTNIALATLVQSLASLNSAANPIIYYLFSTNFCRTLWSLPPFKWLCKKKRRRRDESTTHTQSSSLSEFLTKRRTENTTYNAHAVLVH